MRNDTGRFLILAHEKLNKINDLDTPYGPTIIVIYQWLIDRFANRFAKQWFAHCQPYDPVHALHGQTHQRRLPR